VTFVLPVSERLDEKGFESLVSGWTGADSLHLLLDARHVRWVSPYGVLGLLAVGAAWRDRSGERALLQPPEGREVISYLSRIGFYEAAHEIFDLPERARRRATGESDSLLEITSIESHQDVHDVVDRVKDRAVAILGKRLGYPPPAVLHFSVILSEVCQNIVEHAGADGWVSAQAYNWKQRLGRQVAVIAVMDVGMGFRGSLAREHAQQYGDRWSDETALEAAFLHGVSRYRDPGRGQGLQGIRKQVSRWNGLFTIRSGSAQIAEVPEWIEKRPISGGLADFPGAQIMIVLPELVRADGDTRVGGAGGDGNG
jgi:anti-sigma regulatory factor (Ser/Thr protein kinase)